MLPGVSWSEFLLIAIVAIIVIGPKDLPRVMRTVGRLLAKARGMAREFQSSFEDMAREAEMAELRDEAAKLRAQMMPLDSGPPTPLAPLTPAEEETLISTHNAKVLEAEAASMAPAESAAPAAGTAVEATPAGGDNVTPLRGIRR